MVTTIPVCGFIDENSYLFSDPETGLGFLIDPGAEEEEILDVIRQKNCTVRAILLTHGHFDHIGAVNGLRKVLNVPVYAHENAPAYLENEAYNLSPVPLRVENIIPVKDGEIISLPENPSYNLKVIYTPGHTTDSVVYYCGARGLAFTGDTIFCGSYGNPGFPGGNIKTLFDSIKNRILTLNENTVLYSGHSGPTTVGRERPDYL